MTTNVGTVLAAVVLGVLSAPQLLAGSEMELVKAISLSGVNGRIDHMTADVKGERLFVAALGNNTVEVVDLKAGRRLRSLSGLHEPQGVVFIPAFNRLFVANGESGICTVFDAQTLRKTASVKIGPDADNARYDSAAKAVYIGYGDGALAVVNAANLERSGDVRLDAHPESFRLEKDGARIFVNVPDAGQVAVVDRTTRAVIARWPLKTARANFPMNLDETDHRLFIGCRDPARILVYDTETGRQVAMYPIGGDTDDIFYDRQRKRVYISCGAGSIEIIEQLNPNTYKRLEKIPTAPGARTSLYIPELDLLCLAVPHRGVQPAEIRVYKPRFSAGG